MVDSTGTRIYKGSSRCPGVHTEVWKLLPPSAKKLHWDEYNALSPEEKARIAGGGGKKSGGPPEGAAAMCIVDPVDAPAAAYAPEGFALCDEPDAEPDPAPAMPTVQRPKGFKRKHRDKIPLCELPFSACVARPVKKPEISANKAAQEAMD